MSLSFSLVLNGAYHIHHPPLCPTQVVRCSQGSTQALFVFFPLCVLFHLIQLELHFVEIFPFLDGTRLLYIFLYVRTLFQITLLEYSPLCLEEIPHLCSFILIFPT